MKTMFNEGNQIHNFISSSGSGTVIYYGSGSGSDYLTKYGSGSTGQKVTVPVPVPQRCPAPTVWFVRRLLLRWLSGKFYSLTMLLFDPWLQEGVVPHNS